MNTTMAKESRAKGQLSTTMLTAVTMMVNSASKVCGRLWLMNWRMVSTSLV